MRKLSLILVGIAYCVFAGDRVDPAVQAEGNKIAAKLCEDAKSILPADTRISISAKDGLVFEWNIDAPGVTDFKGLAKAASVPRDDARAAFQAWAESIHPKLLKLTAEAVKASGSDPEFNPETDFTLYVFGRIPGVADDENFCWISFTGSRRDEQHDMKTQAVTCPASAPASGGEVRVTITPDRSQWGLHETITGSITITNIGSTRVHFNAWWIDTVKVTDEAGKEATSFSIRGCIDPAPNAPWYEFISAGKEYTAKFEVITDRIHSMRNGYYLPEGKWKLCYGQGEAENVKVHCDSVDISVAVKPGEYAGPRIRWAQAHGPNLVLLREDGIVDIVDGATGKHLGAKRLRGSRPNESWNDSPLIFSGDGRLMAYCLDREAPIQLMNLYGDAPALKELPAPKGIQVGPGGFTPIRFSKDGSQLTCISNGLFAVLDVATGEPVRSQTVAEMWSELSPDGVYAVCMDNGSDSGAEAREKDDCRISIRNLQDSAATPRKVTLKGRAQSPQIVAGTTGVWLVDEKTTSAVLVSYHDGKVTEFQTGVAPILAGESSDGSLAAFDWARQSSFAEPSPSSVAVFRVANAEKLCTVTEDGARKFVLLSKPARLVALTWKTVKDGFGGGSWLTEYAAIYDATSGKLSRTLDLTPPEEYLPAAEDK